jgi:hypothetical protein
MDFSDAVGAPNEKWELVDSDAAAAGATAGVGMEAWDGGCIIDYASRVHKWQNVSSITVHLPRSFTFDDDEEEQEMPTKLFYLGFRGTPSNKLTGVRTVDCVYEATPQLEDHKAFGESGAKAGF